MTPESTDRRRCEILGRIQLATEAQLDWIRTAVQQGRSPEEIGLCLFEQAEAQRELQSALLDYLRYARNAASSRASGEPSDVREDAA
ncbi:MAG TPA: hypothetical protein RMG48_07605 [Myxococcales bacterium LLY-WYZ-16_1]|jgi:hypothetical protein|nr:hypothetical protein [Myxococcales bacterium LLY-WYZ-16_1]